MKTFKKYLEQLDETLSPKQRKWIDNRTPYDQGREHNELFRNPPEGATKIDDHSFTIPLAPVDRTRENEISDHLSQHGYTIHDYVNDHVTDKHGRTTSIGKALGKTKKDPKFRPRHSMRPYFLIGLLSLKQSSRPFLMVLLESRIDEQMIT